MSETILEEAQKLVYGERARSYGSAAESYGRIAKMFSTLTGKEMLPSEAAMFMILVKLDREQYSPKRDNRVDGAGYFAVLDMIQEDKEEWGESLLTPAYHKEQERINEELKSMVDRLPPAAVPEGFGVEKYVKGQPYGNHLKASVLGPKNPPRVPNDHPRG